MTKGIIPSNTLKNEFKRIPRAQRTITEIEDQRIRLETYIDTYSVQVTDGFLKVFREHIVNKEGKKVKIPELAWVIFDEVPYGDKAQIVHFDKTKKAELARSYGAKPKNIMDCILQLVDCDVMIRIKDGHYIFNPYFVSRGSASQIQEAREKIKYCVYHKCIDKYEQLWYNKDTKIVEYREDNF